MLVEHHQTILAVVAGVGLVSFMLCYILGGRAGLGKWIRRYVGGIGFAILCQFIAWKSAVWVPLMVLSLVTYPAALSMGYGADEFWTKAWRRALYGKLDRFINFFID